MKKIAFIVLLILIVGIVSFELFDNTNYLESHKSPDGKYELLVKNSLNIFGTTMPGDGGKSRPVEVILKSEKGKVIGRSSTNSDCGVLWFSINVIWDIENNEVWYAKSKTINLKTGKVEC